MQSLYHTVRRLGVGVTLAAGALAAPALAAAQGSSLPAAREVIAKYVTALGGEAAIRKHTSTYTKASLQAGPMGSVDMEMFAAAPNKSVVKITLPGMGELNQGFDGTVGWQVGPQGAKLLDGKELEQRKAQADYYARLFKPADYSSMETVAVADFEGTKAYKVRMIRTVGDTVFAYFDPTSALMIGTTTNAVTDAGVVPVTVVYANYKEFGGVKSPTTITQRIGPQELVTTVTSIEYDRVDPAVFAVPPSVKPGK